MRWIVYDLFCLVFAMRTVKQNKSGGTTFHVTREQATWLMNNNVNPGDYFRAAVNVPAHERRALAIRMVNEQLDRDIIAKEERKAHEWAAIQYEEMKEERKAHEWAAIQYEEMHGLINEIVETSDPEHRGALRLQLGEFYGEVGLDALAEAEESARMEAKARDAWDAEAEESARMEAKLKAEFDAALAEAEESARMEAKARDAWEAEDAEAWHLAMAKARDAWDRVEVPADAPHAAAINAKLKAEFDAALAAEIGLNLPNV